MKLRRLASIFFICCTALLVWGCEEGVDPFVGEEKPFTLWGYMDTGSDTQMVRVFTIEDRLGLDRSGPIDAEVVSIDITTGERRTWQDSVVVFEGIGEGHVFWSDFTAQHEHRYRLEVRRSDGATSSVEVTAPSGAEIYLPGTIRSPVIPGRIISAAPNIVDAHVIYRVIPIFPQVDPPLFEPPSFILPVRIPYSSKLESEADGWSLEMNMSSDFAGVKAELARNCVQMPIGLRNIELRFLVADSSWLPPGSVFDPEVLIEPNVFTNVENGFGFFGAGETVSQTLLPPSSVRKTVGFSNDIAGRTCPFESCDLAWPCFRCEEALTPEIRKIYCDQVTNPPF